MLCLTIFVKTGLAVWSSGNDPGAVERQQAGTSMFWSVRNLFMGIPSWTASAQGGEAGVALAAEWQGAIE